MPKDKQLVSTHANTFMFNEYFWVLMLCQVICSINSHIISFYSHNILGREEIFNYEFFLKEKLWYKHLFSLPKEDFRDLNSASRIQTWIPITLKSLLTVYFHNTGFSIVMILIFTFLLFWGHIQQYLMVYPTNGKRKQGF